MWCWVVILLIILFIRVVLRRCLFRVLLKCVCSCRILSVGVCVIRLGRWCCFCCWLVCIGLVYWLCCNVIMVFW